MVKRRREGPMSAAEAREAAETEGLVLATSKRGKTGFLGVAELAGQRSTGEPGYYASVWESAAGGKGKALYLKGVFATAEEAALTRARAMGGQTDCD